MGRCRRRVRCGPQRQLVVTCRKCYILTYIHRYKYMSKADGRISVAVSKKGSVESQQTCCLAAAAEGLAAPPPG